jgi:hypothetical protein
MKTLLEKTNPVILEKSFLDICVELDNRKNEFEKS